MPFRRSHPGARSLLAATLLLAIAGGALAQDSAAKAPEARPTGLPSKGTWTFNLDAGVGWFSFGQSLYRQTRPDDPPSNTGANWGEGYVKPAISGTYATGKSELYGKFSVVGEKTFSAPPPLVGSDASSYGIEDAYVGWRSGKSLSIGENALDFTVGSAPYKIGQGLLLWDGGGEGGVRGGFWSNARKAWQFAGIGRFNAKGNTLEFFYLDRNEVPGWDLHTHLWGANYQLELFGNTTFGASYLKLHSDSFPEREGMNVYNARIFSVPFKKLPGLDVQLEYAGEDNGSLMSSYAWYAQAAYQISEKGWKPKVTYRYAFFEGNDPTTAKSEAFDPLFPGFYDWGTWWQGEIGGEYFLSNSNLISHELRLSLAPTDKVSPGLIAYSFLFDKAPIGVTSSSIAFEIDAYCDWKVSPNFTWSFVAAYADPKEGAKQAYNRTDALLYGMIYLAYAY